MLGELEDAILAQLGGLKAQLPRLRLDSYGGELSDPDLVTGLLNGGPSILITTPKVVFRRRGVRRYNAAVVFRLVIASGNARGERERRRGSVATDPGSYWIWQSCMDLLTDWQHTSDGARVQPTEFANLVTGKYQSQHLSVLGQSFAIDLDWLVTQPPWPDLEGIDLTYHTPANNPETVATDRIDLEE